MGDSVTILIDAVTILPQPLFGAWVLCRLLPMRRPKSFMFLYTATILVLHGLFLWAFLFPPAVKMAVMFLVMLLFVCLFSQRGSRLAALGITLLYTALLVLAEFLTIFLLLLLLDAEPGRSMGEYLNVIAPNLLATRCAYTALCLLMLLPLYWVWRRLLRTDPIRSVPELFPFLLVHSAMLLMGELMLLLCGRVPARLLPAALITAALSCGALAAVLWVYYQEQRRHHLQLKNQSLSLQARATQMERTTVASREEQVRAMEGELRDRIREIGTALDRRAGQMARERIDQAARWLRHCSAPRYCENTVVDLVMGQQALRCRAARIRLDCALELPKALGVGEAELCSVFSNLMDNAVRACTALPEERRRIELSAALRGPYLIIRERNPAPEAPAAGAEGLGLGILREIARRHDGELEVSGKEGQFTATLWLRLGVRDTDVNGGGTGAELATGHQPGEPPLFRDASFPLLLLPLSQLVLVGLILDLWRRSGQPVHWGGVLLVLCLGLTADLMLVQLFRRLRDTQRLQQRAMALEAELSTRRAYLAQMEQTSLQLRQLRHDMNNHLQALGLLIGEGELEQASAYLDELAQDLAGGPRARDIVIGGETDASYPDL